MVEPFEMPQLAFGGELRDSGGSPARPDCRFFSKYQPAPCYPSLSVEWGRPAFAYSIVSIVLLVEIRWSSVSTLQFGTFHKDPWTEMLAGDVVAPHRVADPFEPMLPVVRLRGCRQVPACITRARFVAVQPARGAILPKFRTRKAANGLG
jgi:hypothetical protein